MHRFLWKHISTLLGSSPFSQWDVERSVENDLEEPVIQYEFKGHPLAIRCDKNDLIGVIFMRSDIHSASEVPFFEIPFTSSRNQVLNRWGTPEKSGPKRVDPILGAYGAWDRFSLDGYAIHIEFCKDKDEIRRITLMRKDMVP